MRKETNSLMGEFTILHNRLYGKVFSFVRLRIKDKEEAKDIVQDVFLKAFKSWQEAKDGFPDENTARNFLYVIAKQRMIDLWRSSRFKLQTDLTNSRNDESWGEEDSDFDTLPGEELLPEDLFQESEKKEFALNLLNKLKKDEREILVLRFLEELEYKELARIYQTSEANIRQKVSRSLQNLKKVATK